MSVEFTEVSDQLIDFTSGGIGDLAQKTIMFRFNLDDFPPAGGTSFFRRLDGSSNRVWSVDVFSIGLGRLIRFANDFSDTSGTWITDADPISAGTDYHLAVSYDNSAVGNDPIFYLDGSSITVNESATPVGTANTGEGNFIVGSIHDASFPSIDGKMWDVRVYNEILDQARITEAFENDLFISPINGLVFHTPFLGADGLKKFTGVLAGSNFVYDYMSGAKGTPAQSPIAHPETELAFPFAYG